ncbi:amidase [Hoeflea prorocentri]|uniref:Indoleacetamide hydrolase n=1 Tax=Hoeflea prorocentri TaxID=1922333 RepID=A0A9X3UGN0_9HYPH|nr:amidase [Hoeflea prorocentri]MCY6380362.1 amidase [Hoeflea prorocentri]MDA5398162.1 amidase [Hoeflea prorocentri]
MAGLIRQGAVSPEQVLEAAIARITRLNPSLNAVVETMFEQARGALAETANGGDAERPLFGVPALVKDLHTLVAGSTLTHGSAYFEGHVSTGDSDIVRRMRSAGLSVIGRTNTPEFGLNTTTEGRFHGPAVNPWKRDRSPGGSSGGSAVAVASGMVPVAHATDSGGSIRIPAACCGLVGLKPSRGRIFAGLDPGEGWHDMFNAFAVTRSIGDTALLLDCLANTEKPAPYIAAGFSGSFRTLADVSVPAFSIGVLTTPTSGARVDSRCTAAVERVASACRLLGHAIQPIKLDYDVAAFADAFTKIISASVAATVHAHTKAHGRQPNRDDFEPAVWQALELGNAISGAELNLATASLHLIAGDILREMAGLDLILSPTIARPPIQTGSLDTNTDDLSAFLARVFAFAPFTSIYNATGQPAISLPVDADGDGLPVGVQFAAEPGREDQLLQIGWQMEHRFPWRDRQLALIRSL